VWGIVSKAAEKEVSPIPMQVISTAGVLFAWVLVLSPNLRKVAPGGDARRHFLLGGIYAFGTGLCGGLGNLAMLQSLRAGGEASMVFPLTGMFPLVTVFLAVLVLRERLNRVQIVGIGVALVALFLFNYSPAGAETTTLTATQWLRPWVAYALLALALWGIAGVLQKLATNHISTELSTVLFAAAFVPVAVFLALTNAITWNLTAKGWTLALLFGALIGIGTLVLFAAYRDGKASVVTALYALYPALTVLLAIPIFGERLDFTKGAAIVLAIAAGVALSCERPAAPPSGFDAALGREAKEAAVR
jgi:uncharacterized membrane protein